MKTKFAALLLSASLISVAQAAAEKQDNLAAFQANVAKRLKGDYRGYATPFSGIYSLNKADEKDPKTPVLADLELSMLANSFSEAWAYFRPGNPPVEADRVKAIRAQAVAELPLHSSIVVQFRESPVSMAVYSAVDCGFCRRLETFLHKHKLSYAVFPGSLNRENFSLAKSIWCNPEPGRAWLGVMLHNRDIPSVDSCPGYPISDIRYTGALFSYGNTPGIIFADGDVIARLPMGPQEESEFLQIVKNKIEKGIVFSVPGGD